MLCELDLSNSNYPTFNKTKTHFICFNQMCNIAYFESTSFELLFWLIYPGSWVVNRKVNAISNQRIENLKYTGTNETWEVFNKVN